MIAIYPRRNVTAADWITCDMLSFCANANTLASPTHSDNICCDYLSVTAMDQWIIFGFMMCHSSLAAKNAARLWTLALQSGWVVSLFRDEVIYTHKEIINFFQGIKHYGKKCKEVKDLEQYALQHTAIVHKDRREYLRSAMREIILICEDEPGIIAPKLLHILTGLCYCRDEVTIFALSILNALSRIIYCA